MQRPFARVLFALGIEEVGEVIGRNLALHFRDIDALLRGEPRRLEEVAGRRREDGRADPRAARRAAHARADRATCAPHGLQFAESGPPPSEGPLAGLTFVLTGTLPELTREQADRDDRRARAGASRARSRRRPTISSPVRAPARSSRRPSAWRSRCSTKPGCSRCWRARLSPGSEPA